MKRITLTRERSGRSGRRRGSQKPGTRTAASAAAGCARVAGICCTPEIVARRPATRPSRSDAIRRFMRYFITVMPSIRHYLQGAVVSQIPPQIRRRRFACALEVEGSNETTILVHEIDDGGMVHGVAALIQKHLFVINPIRFRDRGD